MDYFEQHNLHDIYRAIVQYSRAYGCIRVAMDSHGVFRATIDKIVERFIYRVTDLYCHLIKRTSMVSIAPYVLTRRFISYFSYIDGLRHKKGTGRLKIAFVESDSCLKSHSFSIY